MAFNNQEASILKYEWRPFAEDYRVNGMAVFTALFAKFPDYQRLFKSYAPKSWESLSGNVRLMCHAQYVMKAIGDCVQQTDRPGAIENMWRKLGGEHNTRGLTGQMFANIFKLIIDQMVICNAGKLHRSLWEKYFKYGCEKMAEGLKTCTEVPPPTPSDEALRDVYKEWDVDRDGALTVDELYDVMVNLAEDIDHKEIFEMIREADINKDGRIQFDEFIAVFRRKQVHA